jgi:UDP-N-acetylglucosamine 2-epimerase (non-hydrolysing)
MREMSKYPCEFEQVLVHTGQHYDATMSQVFFDELDLPRPDINLDVGSGSHAEQTAQIMLRFEPVIRKYQPDWVVVPGDVNSTLACALVACKLGIKIAHVEAGLRSFDRTMPEEINRVLTDSIADLLLTPSADGDVNLIREGIHPDKIRCVGNIMIDTLKRLLPMAEARWHRMRHILNSDQFVLVTLHRPSNVDDPGTLQEILHALNDIADVMHVVFPVHPRTRQRILQFGYSTAGLQMLDPLSYLDFLALEAHATLVLTDSGGVQEETTYLKVPCLTARPNTERPVTVTSGTNQLVESKRECLVNEARARLNGSAHHSASTRPVPALWDGRTAERTVAVFRSLSTAN